MTRPADMTESELVNAVRAINDALSVRPMKPSTQRILDRHRECLIEQLSLRDEDRAEGEEQRRVDAYMDEVHS